MEREKFEEKIKKLTEQIAVEKKVHENVCLKSYK